MRAIFAMLKAGSSRGMLSGKQRCLQVGRNLMNQGQITSNATNDFSIKLARAIAGLMIAAAGVKVLPFASSALVDHTIKLLRTEQPFLQDAGLSRLYYLIYFDSAKKKAMELGAVEALVDLLNRRESLSPETQNKPLMILNILSSLEGFRERLDCSSLLNLLYSFESAQLDGDCDYWAAPNYSVSRDLYKRFCP
jgi:hypothetical protein